MKTSISLPDRVFEEAEELARKLKISRSELYARAVETFVRERRDENVTETLNRVYADGGSKLDPVLAKLQFAALRRSDW
jgi:metal-responsive CopG/Arc/MetJ family transcriptional regulator